MTYTSNRRGRASRSRRAPETLDYEIFSGLRRVGAIRSGATGWWAVTVGGSVIGPYGSRDAARAALLEEAAR